MIGYIITKLTQHAGFTNWIQHIATIESMNRLEEYKLYCKANDEPMTIDGYDIYLNVLIRGGDER